MGPDVAKLRIDRHRSKHFFWFVCSFFWVFFAFVFFFGCLGSLWVFVVSFFGGGGGGGLFFFGAFGF